jgi:glutaminyl-peptide cyclotransferase
MRQARNVALWLSLVAAVAGCRYGAGASHEQSRTRSVPKREGPAIPVREVPFYTYEVVNRYPHDAGAYTQGLVYHEGALFESTGLYGSSSLRKVELETGQVVRKVDLPPQYFGEGLALFDGRAIQLTWQTQLGFVYDQSSFEVQRTFGYAGEGWGLAQDGESLIMSDGTDQIRFFDPETFQTRRAVSVTYDGRPVRQLNELEYIAGEIYANVYLTDRIARIDPQSGRVTAWVDLAGLLAPEDRRGQVDVLNGIAYDAGGDRLFVTGKLWPKLFEVKLRQK